MKIFVYGTLKKGFKNNYLLSTSEYLGKAKTKNKFGFFKSIHGEYPFLIESTEDTIIPGEVYDINKEIESQLDILEGFPTLYIKKEVDLITEKGDNIKATTYIKNEKNYKDLIDYDAKLNNW